MNGSNYIAISATPGPVEAGDTVLLGVSRDTPTEQFPAIREQLEELFPGVKFVFLGGGATVEAVFRLHEPESKP